MIGLVLGLGLLAAACGEDITSTLGPTPTAQAPAAGGEPTTAESATPTREPGATATSVPEDVAEPGAPETPTATAAPTSTPAPSAPSDEPTSAPPPTDTTDEARPVSATVTPVPVPDRPTPTPAEPSAEPTPTPETLAIPTPEPTPTPVPTPTTVPTAVPTPAPPTGRTALIGHRELHPRGPDHSCRNRGDLDPPGSGAPHYYFRRAGRPRRYLGQPGHESWGHFWLHLHRTRGLSLLLQDPRAVDGGHHHGGREPG